MKYLRGLGALLVRIFSAWSRFEVKNEPAGSFLVVTHYKCSKSMALV
jgi:hypothetical protein